MKGKEREGRDFLQSKVPILMIVGIGKKWGSV